MRESCIAMTAAAAEPRGREVYHAAVKSILLLQTPRALPAPSHSAVGLYLGREGRTKLDSPLDGHSARRR